MSVMSKNKKIKVETRNSAFVDLKDWCIFSTGPNREDKGDFLEVTEWTNGEGYDVHISDPMGEKVFQLTWGQMRALNKCVKRLNKQHEEQI